jgi:hypothetical protein
VQASVGRMASVSGIRLVLRHQIQLFVCFLVWFERCFLFLKIKIKTILREGEKRLKRLMSMFVPNCVQNSIRK